MAFSIQFLRKDRAQQGALALHTVAILDFLNSVQSPHELNQAVVKDDPGRFGSRMGYGIGEKVARRIIAARNAAGGFSRLDQLANIKGFGEDKLHDLLYTFVKLRIPLPSGHGEQFDDFIAAVGALESAFSGTTTRFLTALRKLFHKEETGAGTSLNWGEVFPHGGAGIPVEWSGRSYLRDAVSFIVNNPEILIDDKPVNTHTLLSGLDARAHTRSISLLNDQLSFVSNQHYASYLNPLSLAQHSYLEDHDPRLRNQNTVLHQGKLQEAFLSNMTFAQYYASADVFALPLDTGRALVWNLLNYYTERYSPIKDRFAPFIEALDLGALQEQKFARYADAFPVIQRNVLQAYINVGQQNSRPAYELDALDTSEADQPLFTNLHAIATTTTDLFLDILAFLLVAQKEQPAVLTWNRLEGRPKTEEFTQPLRAEIRDPLWMLCRQYQMGEFQGEDAGSAIETRVKTKTSQLEKVALGNQSTQNYEQETPLEMAVEKQAPPVDFLTVMEMNRKWNELLRSHMQDNMWSVLMMPKIQKKLQEIYPLPTAESGDPLLSGHAANTIQLLILSGQFNAYELFLDLDKGSSLQSIIEENLLGLGQLAAAFMSWAKATVLPAHSEESDAWDTAHLEYQFACSAPVSSDMSSLMVADEYPGGHLDWYSFDHQASNNNLPGGLTPISPDTDLITEEVLTAIPSLITYPGMPNPRWWQMEDYAVNLDQLDIDKSDAATLAFAEFATLYSNDWLLIPYAMPHGSICEVKSMIIKDVFGQYTLAEAAGGDDPTDWERWSMFDLHQRGNNTLADHRLFLPPSLVNSAESAPVESVSFIRDEMANMVWGVEMVVPDGFGNGVDGFEAGLKLKKAIAKATEVDTTPRAANLQKTDASIKYQLGNEVPENWIPFIPVKKKGDPKRMIQLQRAAMPRIIPGKKTKRIRPRTDLLRVNHHPENAQPWQPYYIYEEEVPRAGIILNRRWQRTRWYNGKHLLWMANQKRNGRGQANSGLEFDKIISNKEG